MMMTRLKFAKQTPNMERSLHPTYEANLARYKQMVQQPLLLALESPHPEVALGILERGADPNLITPQSEQYIGRTWYSRFTGESMLDVADRHLHTLGEYEGNNATSTSFTLPEGIDTYLEKFEEGTYQHWVVSKEIDTLRERYEIGIKNFEEKKARSGGVCGLEEKKAAIVEAITTMEKVKEALLAKGAKTFLELHPELKDRHEPPKRRDNTARLRATDESFKYDFVFLGVKDMTEARKPAYFRL